MGPMGMSPMGPMGPMGMPPMGPGGFGFGGAGFQGTGGYPFFPGAPGVPPMVNPSLNYLQNILQKQEDDNKRLEEQLKKLNAEDGSFDRIAKRAGQEIEDLKNKLMPNGGGIGGGAGNDPFPDDFTFVQNNI